MIGITIGLENPGSAAIYVEMDKNMEKLTNIMMFILKLTVSSILLPRLVATFVFYFIIGQDVEAFHLPYPIW